MDDVGNMDDAGIMDDAARNDEFEPAALHASRAKGNRKRDGGVHMHSVGNLAEACCMHGSARPPPWVREAGCLGEGRCDWGSEFQCG